MVERDFTPHGRMSVQLKDMRNALATARKLALTPPSRKLFGTLYAAGARARPGGLDHSGLFVELASAMHGCNETKRRPCSWPQFTKKMVHNCGFADWTAKRSGVLSSVGRAADS